MERKKQRAIDLEKKKEQERQRSIEMEREKGLEREREREREREGERERERERERLNSAKMQEAHQKQRNHSNKGSLSKGAPGHNSMANNHLEGLLTYENISGSNVDKREGILEAVNKSSREAQGSEAKHSGTVNSNGLEAQNGQKTTGHQNGGTLISANGQTAQHNSHHSSNGTPLANNLALNKSTMLTVDNNRSSQSGS